MAERWRAAIREEMAQTQRLLDNQPEVQGGVILAFLAAYVGLSLLINLVVFRSPWLDPIVRATHGWIQPTLIVNLGLIVVLVFGVVGLGGHVSPRKLIGAPRHTVRATGWTAALWGITQLVGAVALLIRGELAFHPSWSTQGASWLLGGLLAQLAGNALFEEIAFRGFLLPQAHRRLSTIHRPALRIFIAVLISQAVFALIHIPNRIYAGLPLAAYPMDLLRLLGLGALFAVIYLRTGNLFLAVGIHALLNRPTPLVDFSSSSTVLLVLTALLLIVWPWISRNHGGRSTAESFITIPPRE
ncbi:CPBP family intramembrane metalloprotease [Candidatus Bipolaricaulota bacterium]|nr:CPBP family intramembrane metalloprotease [Candidatus Bipolaricaulota bacterium]